MNANALEELHRLEDADTDPPPMTPRRTLRQAMRYHREMGHSWFIWAGIFYRQVNGHWQIEMDSFSDAFDLCRERNRPITVIVNGSVHKIFPSGRADKVRR